MKKKLEDDKPVTRKELESTLDRKLEEKLEEKLNAKLQDYPARKELTAILANYPTKQDMEEILNKRFTNFETAFRREMDFKFEQFEEKFDRKLTMFADKILTAIDPLLEELETRRQDRELASYQYEQMKKTVDNHEKRITALETV